MDTTRQTGEGRKPNYGWGAKQLGSGVLRLQLVLVTVSVTVFALLKILGTESHLPQTLTFTLVIGNWTSFFVYRAGPLYQRRRFPWNWVLFLLALTLVGATGTVLAEVVATFLFFGGDTTFFFKHIVFDLPFAALVTLIFGFINFAFDAQAEKMEARNRELQGQVQLGQV